MTTARREGVIHAFSPDSKPDAFTLPGPVPVLVRDWRTPGVLARGTLAEARLDGGDLWGSIDLPGEIEARIGEGTPSAECEFDGQGRLVRVVLDLDEGDFPEPAPAPTLDPTQRGEDVSDEDKELRELKRRNEELLADLADVKGEAKDRRVKGNKLKEDHEALLLDRDRWKAKAETNAPELQEQVKGLQGRLREVTHKDAFRKLVEPLKLKAGALEPAWTLAGYRPESDDVDEAALGTVIDRTKAAHPYLFEAEAAATAAAPAKLVLPPGTGGGRGTESGTGQFRVKKSEYGDPAFMDKNAAKITEASKAGTLVFVD